MAATDKKEFYKELCALAVPIGLQNLLLALIGASDALMLGRLTQDAISAVSLANQVAFIMNLFIGAVIGGVSVLISQYWGKGDRQMAKNLLCLFLKIGFVISLVFFLLTVFAPEVLMRIYTSDQTLIGIGASYLRIVGVSYLFSSVTQGFFMVMRIEGRAAKTVIISIATLVCDMTIDFFLIYGIAGAPKLGANGSAYSTVVVEFIGMIWCIAEAYRKDNIHPDLQGFRWFSKDVAKDLLGISISMLGSALAWGLGFSAHSLIMGHLGSDATAAASITSVAQELITCVCKGISAGAGIMIGIMLVYILMCADEIVKLPWLLPRYRKYIWLKNLTRESQI